jgi:hypothetical protein
MTFLRSLCLHLARGLARHGYPWVPTDQAHGRPRQVSLAYQKTRRLVSGPNRPSWRPTRPSEDLPENFPNDLIHHDLKTRCTEQDLVDYDQSRSTGYGTMCNVDLGLLVVTDQESGNRPHPLANVRRTRRPLVINAILMQSTPTTGRRVLLSGGPN